MKRTRRLAAGAMIGSVALLLGCGGAGGGFRVSVVRWDPYSLVRTPSGDSPQAPLLASARGNYPGSPAPATISPTPAGAPLRPVVVASRQLRHLQAGERLDAAATVLVTNPSCACLGREISSDVAAARIQLVLTPSASTAGAAAAADGTALTEAPGGALSDYILQHHRVLVARGSYVVPRSLAGQTAYVDVLVAAYLPPGSTFGRFPCLATTSLTRIRCSLLDDSRWNMLSVQRFAPAAGSDQATVVDALTRPFESISFPRRSVSRAHPAIVNYPYTPVWESGPLPGVGGCAARQADAAAGPPACSIVEARADLTWRLGNASGCWEIADGQFYLSRDPNLVAEGRAALANPRYTGEALAAAEHRGELASFEHAFPSYDDYEHTSRSWYLNGDAGTNVTDEEAGRASRSAHGGLSIYGSVPVPADLPPGTWHVGLAVAPGETVNYCPRGGTATLDAGASHAEALVFGPARARQRGWSEVPGTAGRSARQGTALRAGRLTTLYTDRVTLAAGDIVDVSGVGEIRDSLLAPKGAAPVLTLQSCLLISGRPINPCSSDDFSNRQLAYLSTPVAHSAVYVVPASFGTTPRGVDVSFAVRATSATNGTPPAVNDGIGNLDVQVYAPVGP